MRFAWTCAFFVACSAAAARPAYAQERARAAGMLQAPEPALTPDPLRFYSLDWHLGRASANAGTSRLRLGVATEGPATLWGLGGEPTDLWQPDAELRLSYERSWMLRRGIELRLSAALSLGDGYARACALAAVLWWFSRHVGLGFIVALSADLGGTATGPADEGPWSLREYQAMDRRRRQRPPEAWSGAEPDMAAAMVRAFLGLVVRR